ncbi:M14 family metallopeptidase [Hyphococcus luteus]|nr:M14 family metallopeptidase [Marinicaulis flavus]
MSDCNARTKKFKIRIDPENKPINPSPWYAFRVTPKTQDEIEIVIKYSDARHRYRPKRSEGDGVWRLVDEDRVKLRRKGKSVTLTLEPGTAPFIIAAQEMLIGEAYETWEKDIAARARLTRETIGSSVEGREITALFSAPQTARDEKEYVLFIGRQHPPELTGAFAMLPFLETVFADTQLAKAFRERFHIIAVPLMNPDGVANGHWRHNMNGVDLNRDWGPFTQPETRAVKATLDDIAADANSALRLMFDFHATNRNVFYTQTQEDVTRPPNFTQDWLAAARVRLDGYDFERAERHQSDLDTSKNYVFGRFGAPALTYEVGDKTDRQAIHHSAVIFAEEMMKELLAGAGSPLASAGE